MLNFARDAVVDLQYMEKRDPGIAGAWSGHRSVPLFFAAMEIQLKNERRVLVEERREEFAKRGEFTIRHLRVGVPPRTPGYENDHAWSTLGSASRVARAPLHELWQVSRKVTFHSRHTKIQPL